MNVKAKNISKVNTELDQEFIDFGYEADRNPERVSMLFSKATALKRKCNENKSDVKKIEEAIKVLKEKRKKIIAQDIMRIVGERTVD